MTQPLKSHFQTISGVIEWHGEGSLPHRADGPAIIFPNGDREWWIDGELHRDDGPAVMRADGSREWWLNGKPWPEGPVETEKNLLRKEQEKALAAERLMSHERERALALLRAARPKTRFRR